MIRVAFLLAISSSLFTACDDLCNSSSSCISPPNGDFEISKVNLAFHKDAFERFEDGSIDLLFRVDSIIVNTQNTQYLIKEFYSWQPIDPTDGINSITVYSGFTEVTTLSEKFVFGDESTGFVTGGYLLSFRKENDDFLFQIVTADQEWIDGDCNDVITDC